MKYLSSISVLYLFKYYAIKCGDGEVGQNMNVYDRGEGEGIQRGQIVSHMLERPLIYYQIKAPGVG